MINRTAGYNGLLAGLVLLLAACGNSGNAGAGSSAPATSPAAAPAAPAAGTATAAAPASASVQKIYDHSCHTCHGAPATGAPQAGDAKAWAPRLAQGKDTVLGHVINGYKGMPPMGLCMQCSEDDFVAVTEWMSGGQLK